MLSSLAQMLTQVATHSFSTGVLAPLKNGTTLVLPQADGGVSVLQQAKFSLSAKPAGPEKRVAAWFSDNACKTGQETENLLYSHALSSIVASYEFNNLT